MGGREVVGAVEQAPLDAVGAEQAFGVGLQLGREDDGVEAAAGDEDLVGAAAGEALPDGGLAGDGRKAQRREEGRHEALVGVQLPGQRAVGGQVGAHVRQRAALDLGGPIYHTDLTSERRTQNAERRTQNAERRTQTHRQSQSQNSSRGAALTSRRWPAARRVSTGGGWGLRADAA